MSSQSSLTDAFVIIVHKVITAVRPDPTGDCRALDSSAGACSEALPRQLVTSSGDPPFHRSPSRGPPGDTSGLCSHHYTPTEYRWCLLPSLWMLPFAWKSPSPWGSTCCHRILTHSSGTTMSPWAPMDLPPFWGWWVHDVPILRGSQVPVRKEHSALSTQAPAKGSDPTLCLEPCLCACLPAF